VLLIFNTLILGDIVKIIDNKYLYLYFTIKWGIIFMLLGAIIVNLLIIFNTITTKLTFYKNKKSTNDKKERLINKDKLLSKKEIIIRKYQNLKK